MNRCNFQPAEPGILRCTNKGCTNALWAKNASKAGPAKCKSQEGCKWLGEPTGESVSCKGCPGSPRVHAVFGCAVFGICAPMARRNKPTVPSVHVCDGCEKRA